MLPLTNRCRICLKETTKPNVSRFRKLACLGLPSQDPGVGSSVDKLDPQRLSPLVSLHCVPRGTLACTVCLKTTTAPNCSRFRKLKCSPGLAAGNSSTIERTSLSGSLPCRTLTYMCFCMWYLMAISPWKFSRGFYLAYPFRVFWYSHLHEYWYSYFAVHRGLLPVQSFHPSHTYPRCNSIAVPHCLLVFFHSELRVGHPLYCRLLVSRFNLYGFSRACPD